MSAPDHYYPEHQWDPADDGDPEWLPPDDQWITDYDNQFEDARDPYLQPDEPDDGR